jgi:AcrR family transcriptional regulator
MVKLHGAACNPLGSRKAGEVPKQVDHEQRRRVITEALWRIASAHGLEAVSLGQVAAEAGVSKGLVQHYFRTKDQMLLHATGHLRERVERRIAARVDTVRPTALATLRATLAALLPVDDDSRTESLVANAFFIRALQDPDLAARFRDGNAKLRDAVAEQIRAAMDSAELADDLDPNQEADILLALVSGLGEALLLGHHTARHALSTLDHQLARLTRSQLRSGKWFDGCAES